MFLRIRKSMAQSTLEYAIIIAVVVAGMVAMQLYFRRGVSGKVRSSADSIGDQFDPQTTASEISTSATSTSTETIIPAGVTTTAITQTQNRSGSDTIAAQ